MCNGSFLYGTEHQNHGALRIHQGTPVYSPADRDHDKRHQVDKLQDEKEVKGLDEKVSQATEVRSIQNSVEERPGKRLRERLNQPTEQQGLNSKNICTCSASFDLIRCCLTNLLFVQFKTRK